MLASLWQLDHDVFFALFGGDHPGLVLHAMIALTVIGRGYVLWGLAVLALLPRSASAVLPKTVFTPRMQQIAREMLLVLVLIAVLVYFGKAVVQRPRPYVQLGLIPLGGSPRDFSFPSGHAAGAFGFAGFLCARLRPRRWVATLLLTVAFGIALSRIYLGAHFPTDVCAGALLGGLAAFVAGRTLHRREQAAQLANPEEGGA